MPGGDKAEGEGGNKIHWRAPGSKSRIKFLQKKTNWSLASQVVGSQFINYCKQQEIPSFVVSDLFFHYRWSIHCSSNKLILKKKCKTCFFQFLLQEDLGEAAWDERRWRRHYRVHPWPKVHDFSLIHEPRFMTFHDPRSMTSSHQSESRQTSHLIV